MWENIIIRARKVDFADGVDIQVRSGKQYIKNIEWATPKEGQYMSIPFAIDNNHAQTLMDDLWHAGLRPSEGTGSAGALKATQNHLEDMRTLVFNKGSGVDDKGVISVRE